MSDDDDIIVVKGKAARAALLTRRQEREALWPVQTRVVYNDRGTLNKHDQGDAIRNLLDEVIAAFEADFAFRQGIYKTKAERDRVQYLLVLQACRDLKYDDIKERVCKDQKYRNAIILWYEYQLLLTCAAFVLTQLE